MKKVSYDQLFPLQSTSPLFSPFSLRYPFPLRSISYFSLDFGMNSSGSPLGFRSQLFLSLAERIPGPFLRLVLLNPLSRKTVIPPLPPGSPLHFALNLSLAFLVVFPRALHQLRRRIEFLRFRTSFRFSPPLMKNEASFSPSSSPLTSGVLSISILSEALRSEQRFFVILSKIGEVFLVCFACGKRLPVPSLTVERFASRWAL